jgi:hypothetical protein
MLGGQGDGRDVYVSALFQLARPDAFRIGLFIDDAQVSAGAVHKERSQVTIPLLGNRPVTMFLPLQ